MIIGMCKSLVRGSQEKCISPWAVDFEPKADGIPCQDYRGGTPPWLPIPWLDGNSYDWNGWWDMPRLSKARGHCRCTLPCPVRMLTFQVCLQFVVFTLDGLQVWSVALETRTIGVSMGQCTTDILDPSWGWTHSHSTHSETRLNNLMSKCQLDATCR